MSTHRTKFAACMVSLIAGVVLTCLPTGAEAASGRASQWRKPPMPCVVVRLGAYPRWTGFCPSGTARRYAATGSDHVVVA